MVSYYRPCPVRYRRETPALQRRQVAWAGLLGLAVAACNNPIYYVKDTDYATLQPVKGSASAVQNPAVWVPAVREDRIAVRIRADSFSPVINAGVFEIGSPPPPPIPNAVRVNRRTSGLTIAGAVLFPVGLLAGIAGGFLFPLGLNGGSPLAVPGIILFGAGNAAWLFAGIPMIAIGVKRSHVIEESLP